MNARAIVLVAWGIAGAFLAPGCSTYEDPATGAEARYAFETLRADLDLRIGTVYAAAQKAAAELDLQSMRAAVDGISGEIRALDAQLDTVDIQMGAMPGGRTELSIRVGVFGDKDKSIVLFEQIMGNLSKAQRLAAAPSLQWGGAPVEPLR